MVFGAKHRDSQRLLASRRLENWARPIVMEKQQLALDEERARHSERANDFQVDRGCGRS
jgi:hypothetical protein